MVQVGKNGKCCCWEAHTAQTRAASHTIRLPGGLQPVVRVNVRKGSGSGGNLASTTAANVAPVGTLLACRGHEVGNHHTWKKASGGG
jgi:hypothetical protein